MSKEELDKLFPAEEPEEEKELTEEEKRDLKIKEALATLTFYAPKVYSSSIKRKKKIRRKLQKKSRKINR